jgi:putative hydrolase of the HAD superfamily
MVLIFDLDDTLFDEMSYVKSGLRAVATYGRASFGWDERDSYTFMNVCLEKHGRGQVFDQWLQTHDHYSASRVKQCVNVYRHHKPNIVLSKVASQILSLYQGVHSLYLVTDGHKIVQQKKIDALGIEAMFKRCLITHRFGIRHAKPSLYCFEKIRTVEKCAWSSMVYVGDNPAKDFVNLNVMGSLTVRVKTGAHAEVKARFGYDAQHTIQDLTGLPLLLNQAFNNAAKPFVDFGPELTGSNF